MSDVIGYGLVAIAAVWLVLFIIRTSYHADGWRAGLGQYGKAMLVMALGLAAVAWLLLG